MHEIHHKSLVLILALAMLAASICQCQAAGVRLMTFNIHNGIGPDGQRDLRPIADIIDSEAPDIIVLQDVDSATIRSGGRDLLAEIAGHVGMRHIYVTSADNGGETCGMGILCREKPLSVQNITFPQTSGKRALTAAEFGDYVFALPVEDNDLSASLSAVRDFAAECGKPVFIGGDFSPRESDRGMMELGEDFTVIFDADRVIPVKSFVVSRDTALNYRPVVADLRLKKNKADIISVKPYLQNPSADGVTVIWHTSVPSDGIVEYGTDSTEMISARHLIGGQADWGKVHKVRLDGLEPGQKYYYRVISKEILNYAAYEKTFGYTAASRISSFSLPEEDETDFTAVVFNDIHQNAATYRALCKYLPDLKPDFVIFNGDMIDDPYSYEQAAGFLKIINDGIGADSIPAIYIRGNHEIRGPYSIGLNDILDYADGKTYSAFNWGDTRFVVLDCGEDKPDDHEAYFGLNDFTALRLEQQTFLKSELDSKEFKKAKRRVIVHHAPIYGLDVDYTDYNPCLELWGEVLRNAPFDISVNAHTHNFAFHPRNSRDNNFPVIIGGGYGMDSATIIILQKSGNDFSVRALNTSGNVILNKSL